MVDGGAARPRRQTPWNLMRLAVHYPAPLCGYSELPLQVLVEVWKRCCLAKLFRRLPEVELNVLHFVLSGFRRRRNMAYHRPLRSVMARPFPLSMA